MNRSLPRSKPFKQWQPDYDTQKDIITYKIVDFVEKTGEGESDFIVCKKLVVDTRVNRREKFNELGKDRDIYSIIRRVDETGDISLLTQGDEGTYLDISDLPENAQELNDRLSKAIDVWDTLDPELKGKLSLSEFLKSLTDEKLENYFKSKEPVVNNDEGGQQNG